MTHSQLFSPVARFGALAVIALGFAFFFSSPAEACKDCPFPMKVSQGRFLMPNGEMYVDVVENTLPGTDNMVEVVVVLRSAFTDEVLAKGVTRQHRERRTATLVLKDRSCMPVQATIFWLDRGHENVKVRFSCEDCTIEPLFR